MLLQRCTFCEKELPVSEFIKDPSRKNGYRTRCKSCTNEIKKLKSQIKSNTGEQNKQLFYQMYTSNFKNFKVRQYAMIFGCSNDIIYDLLEELNIFRCPKCNQIKTLDCDFFKSSQETHGYMFICKNCFMKSVNIENRRRILKEWQEKNREHVNEYARNYQQLHKNDPKTPEQIESQRKYYRDHMKLKRNLDPTFKLNHNFGTAIWLALKNRNLLKNNIHWENLVGYILEDLIKHLESKFLPGMTWNNYGKWHIDHIIPVSTFYYESYDDEEFKKCWSLDNLQPLWAEDNIKKSNHIGPEWGNIDDE